MEHDYFKSIQGISYGITRKEAALRDAQRTVSALMDNSINIGEKTKRNGKLQKFVITPSQVSYKYKIEAYPNEQLNVGDVIEFADEIWIVTETRIGSPIQIIGTMWLCNLTLNFQNGTSDIISRPAVLDSGVYSTTKNGNNELQYVDKQFKLYLPYDEDTKKLYVDKRIAVDTRYDKNGKEILEVYEVTGINRVARSWGKDGHLLICELRSGTYSPEKDSVEHMICDYIDGGEVPTPAPEKKDCSISGRPTIVVGKSRTYSPVFETEEVEPIWEVVTNAEVSTANIGRDLKIAVSDNEDNIGETILIKLKDADDKYNIATYEVEVIC